MNSRPAISYRRVSTEDQTERYSLPMQKLEIEAYAAKSNLRIVADFFDDSTGYSVDRPGLQSALEMLKQGQAAAIVAMESDRLVRDPLLYMQIRVDLHKIGAELHYARRGKVELGNFAAELIEDINGRHNDQWRKRLIEDTVKGRERKVKSGKVVTPVAPYGYIINPATDELEPHPDLKDIPTIVYDLYVNQRRKNGKRHSIASVARELSRRGIPTHADVYLQKKTYKKQGYAVWSPSSVKHILKSETYIGRWHYNKTSKTMPVDRTRWLPVKVAALVDYGLWEAAQKRLEENKRMSSRNAKHDYLMAKRLTCGECGLLVYAHTYNHGYQYYFCSSGDKRSEQDKCALKYFNCSAVDETIWRWVKRIISDPDYFTQLIEAAFEKQYSQQDEQVAHLERLRANIDKAKAEANKLLDLYLAGDLDKPTYLGKKVEIETRLLSLEDSKRAAAASIGVDTGQRDKLIQLAQLMSEYQEILTLENEPFYIRQNWVDALNVEGVLVMIDGERFIQASCMVDEQLLSIVDLSSRQLTHSSRHRLVLSATLSVED